MAISPLQAEESPRHHAVLVGCTKYFSLPASKHLEGPANDVELMAHLLVTRFGFDKSEIISLSERQKRDRRPRYKNIVREMNELVKRVRRGDTVVILFAGHGSQQPDDDPDNPKDVEPDGLDEIFLPSDVGEFNPKTKKVTNAISDDKIRGWLTTMRNKGAFIWFSTCPITTS